MSRMLVRCIVFHQPSEKVKRFQFCLALEHYFFAVFKQRFSSNGNNCLEKLMSLLEKDDISKHFAIQISQLNSRRMVSMNVLFFQEPARFGAVD